MRMINYKSWIAGFERVQGMQCLLYYYITLYRTKQGSNELVSASARWALVDIDPFSHDIHIETSCVVGFSGSLNINEEVEPDSSYISN